MNDKRMLGRLELRSLFLNGKIPSEKDFEDFIKSTLNLKDDGFLKDPIEGFVIKPMGNSDTFITFYKAIDDNKSFFAIRKIADGIPAVELAPTGNKEQDLTTQESGFVFQENIALGINQKPDPGCKLSVNGLISSAGRIGSLISTRVEANGKWQNILLPGNKYFDECQILEIVARAGKMNTRKYAVMHAYALSAFGGKGSKHTIKRTGAHFGFFWNRIRIRWKSENVNEYYLQIKTSSNYGSQAFIDVRVSKLWDDQFSSNENEKAQ